MSEDPKLVVVKAIEQTGKIIEKLDTEPVHARRYQRLRDEIAALSIKLARAHRLAWISSFIASLALLMALR